MVKFSGLFTDPVSAANVTGHWKQNYTIMNGDFKTMQTYAVRAYASPTTGYLLCNIPIHIVVIIIIIHNDTILTLQRRPLYVVQTSVSSHATGLYMSYNWPAATEYI